MRDLHAQRWHQVVPNFEHKGQQRSNVYEIAGWNGVDVEVRSQEPVVLNGITDEGETVYLASGLVSGYRGRLVGFTALEVVATSPYSIRLDQKKRWFEIVDPTPTVVIVDQSADKPVQDLIKQELAKYVQKLQAMHAFNDEVEVSELLDDINSGELEWEEETQIIDNFGLGYTEMDEETILSEPELPFPDEQNAPAGAPAPAEKTAPAQPATVPTT